MNSSFEDCPICNGENDGCPSCNGTGSRIIDKNAIDLAISAKSWIDDRVDRVYSDYSKIFPTKGDGVTGWSYYGGDYIEVDTIRSCRGCADYFNEAIPSKYLYVDDAARQKMIQEDFIVYDAERKRQEKLSKDREIEVLEKRLSSLRNS